MIAYTKRLNPTTLCLMALTLFVAMMLSVVPMANWLNLFRPAWIALMVCFWVYCFPKQLGVGFAFAIGFLVDALNGATLGQHAFACVVLAALVLKFRRHLLSYSLLQQSVVIALMIFVYKLCLYLLQGFIDHFPPHAMVWLGVLTSFMVWPIVALGLRRYAPR